MGKPYFRERDGMWVMQFELPPKADGTRRRKYVTAKRRADLVAKARAVRGEIDRTGDMVTNAPALGKWLDYWLEEIASPTLRPRTIENYTYMIGLMKPSIGLLHLDKLQPSHVRRMHKHLMDDCALSSTTARNAHAVLRKALNDAMTEGAVGRNVAQLVPAPPRAHYQAKYLDAEQGARLLLSVADDPRAAIRWSLALLMGMRQGECLGLRADHVNLKAGTITVEWQLQQLSKPPRRGSKYIDLGDGYYLTPPKTEAGSREVPMPEALAEMMRRYVPALPSPEAFVCGPGIIDDRTDARAWERALKAADLPIVSLHSARHTTLTLLARLGAPDHVRQRIAGHASKEVLKIYTHAEIDDLRDAMASLGEALVTRRVS